MTVEFSGGPQQSQPSLRRLGNHFLAQPALKRRPKFKSSLRDEE
jgi:hypothetical protein